MLLNCGVQKSEKTLESPLDCKEIQPVHPKWDQSWVFIGRSDVEAETPVLWPPDANSWLIWKDPDAGKDWRQEEKGTTEDEMVGCHQLLDGHGLAWNPGVGDGQGGLACCSSWGHKESDTTEWLNWTETCRTWLNFKVLHRKGNYKQDGKTAIRMGDNNSIWNNWRRINFQNIQTAHTTQYQKNKQPNQKLRKDLNRHFSRHTDG